jgi:hypothetical protein
MTFEEQIKASLAYDDFSSDWKDIIAGQRESVEIAREYLRGAERNIKTCEFVLRQQEEMLSDSIKRAQAERSQRDPQWCYTCDRTKNDCACVENGGNY